LNNEQQHDNNNVNIQQPRNEEEGGLIGEDSPLRGAENQFDNEISPGVRFGDENGFNN
jgi:hypothetical protein